MDQILPKGYKGYLHCDGYSTYNQLTESIQDGQLALSNNLAERSILPVVLGRKNDLFSSCAEGAHANSVYYTIVETAKANGLNVRSYLKHLLTCLPQIDFLTEEALSKFLPWHPTVQLVCQQTVK